ncbi:hypothetical protein [Xenorhabdus anantnagensis]|uniref:Uncharacterized protein n=1 Tax=Xenorhabdus anantnagensis TaxID=3025875 RepID=A0ABT5LUW6_9GAMM|nr:hypothetical protein [Xenorhabdus anantnagensis]MDC9598215.1 hypothetical protein [Xenorhabdus anantnagensis]
MKNKNNFSNNADSKTLFPDLRFLAENRKLLAEKELDLSLEQVRHILIRQGTTIQELFQWWFNGQKGRLYFQNPGLKGSGSWSVIWV